MRTRGATHRPEDYCPICGLYVGKTYDGHRCAASVLAAINAANTRAERADEDGRLFCEQLIRRKAARFLEGHRLLDEWRNG